MLFKSFVNDHIEIETLRLCASYASYIPLAHYEFLYTAEGSLSLTASYYAHQCYLGLIRNIGVYLMGYPVHTNMFYHALYLLHTNR